MMQSGRECVSGAEGAWMGKVRSSGNGITVETDITGKQQETCATCSPSAQLIFPVTSCPIPHTFSYLRQRCIQAKHALSGGSKSRDAPDDLTIPVQRRGRGATTTPGRDPVRLMPVTVLLFFLLLGLPSCPATRSFPVDCDRLLRGQFSCDSPVIDPLTQQPAGCTRNNTAPVNCTLIDGLVCRNTSTTWFVGTAECQWTNGYSFETSLLLSIFLGMFGADRFYLGYPGLGLLKFCTLGFLFFGQLADIVLIAMQVVGPADGSNYVIKYFGPKLSILHTTNDTFFVPYDDM